MVKPWLHHHFTLRPPVVIKYKFNEGTIRTAHCAGLMIKPQPLYCTAQHSGNHLLISTPYLVSSTSFKPGYAIAEATDFERAEIRVWHFRAKDVYSLSSSVQYAVKWMWCALLVDLIIIFILLLKVVHTETRTWPLKNSLKRKRRLSEQVNRRQDSRENLEKSPLIHS